MNAAEPARAGLAPSEVARHVFEAIRDERFYIVTDPDEWKPLIRERMDDILKDRNPRIMGMASQSEARSPTRS